MTTIYSGSYAAFYDRYYTDWTRMFSERLANYLSHTQGSERSVLDLCCGTGAAVNAFCEAGWRVIGLDISRDMLNVAKTKLWPLVESGKVSFMRGDATDFVLSQQVGACVSLDGALNHLESLSQLKHCFKRVAAALLDGGQFLFDLLETNHFRGWNNISLIDDVEATVSKRGAWDDDMRMGMLRISGVFGKDSSCTSVRQTLRSHAYSPSEVESALSSAGLESVECDLSTPACRCGRSEVGPCRTLYRALKPVASESN